MNYELTTVVWLAVILLVLTFIQGGLVPVTHGLKWGFGSRDEPRDPTALQLRIKRTIANHIEAMLIYVPIVLVAAAMGISNDGTQLGAMLFLIGRVLFVPLYLFGVPVLRSAAYGLAIIGLFQYLWELIPQMF